MKYSDKVEKVKCGRKLKKGYSLATVYRINPKTVSTYELLNFGYCPNIKEFYFNKNVDFPEELVKQLEKMPISKETENFLLSLGLHPYDHAEMLVSHYERAKEDVTLTRHRALHAFDKGNK